MAETGKSSYLKWLYLTYELHIQRIRVSELLRLQYKEVVAKDKKGKGKGHSITCHEVTELK